MFLMARNITTSLRCQTEFTALDASPSVQLVTLVLRWSDLEGAEGNIPEYEGPREL
jgi:hypothetical protein